MIDQEKWHQYYFHHNSQFIAGCLMIIFQYNKVRSKMNKQSPLCAQGKYTINRKFNHRRIQTVILQQPVSPPSTTELRQVKQFVGTSLGKSETKKFTALYSYKPLKKNKEIEYKSSSHLPLNIEKIIKANQNIALNNYKSVTGFKGNREYSSNSQHQDTDKQFCERWETQRQTTSKHKNLDDINLSMKTNHRRTNTKMDGSKQFQVNSMKDCNDVSEKYSPSNPKYFNDKQTNNNYPKTNFYEGNKTEVIAEFEEDKFDSADNFPETKIIKTNIIKNYQQASTGTTSSPTATNSVKVSRNKYAIQGIAGKGTFGVVYFGKIKLSGQKIAIKKVLQDKKYKNRELQILKSLEHDNLLRMKDHYFSNQGPNQEEYLNVIMDYYPDNLYQVIKKRVLNPKLIKKFAYQILKGLKYLAEKSIAHRDIKPQNILVDLNSKQSKVVICDFGSAKKLISGEPNIAYICSRCYRSPELIFGATEYSCQIDMWSVGCVIVQMINGEAPFLGDSQLDQLLEIIRVLGTPTKNQIYEMNPDYDLKDYKKFPNIKAMPWQKVLKCSDPLLFDLIKNILEYSPVKRLTPAQALKHPYFDDLKIEETLKYNKNKQYDLRSLDKVEDVQTDSAQKINYGGKYQSNQNFGQNQQANSSSTLPTSIGNKVKQTSKISGNFDQIPTNKVRNPNNNQLISASNTGNGKLVECSTGKQLEICWDKKRMLGLRKNSTNNKNIGKINNQKMTVERENGKFGNSEDFLNIKAINNTGNYPNSEIDNINTSQKNIHHTNKRMGHTRIRSDVDHFGSRANIQYPNTYNRLNYNSNGFNNNMPFSHHNNPQTTSISTNLNNKTKNYTNNNINFGYKNNNNFESSHTYRPIENSDHRSLQRNQDQSSSHRYKFSGFQR